MGFVILLIMVCGHLIWLFHIWSLGGTVFIIHGKCLISWCFWPLYIYTSCYVILSVSSFFVQLRTVTNRCGVCIFIGCLNLLLRYCLSFFQGIFGVVHCIHSRILSTDSGWLFCRLPVRAWHEFDPLWMNIYETCFHAIPFACAWSFRWVVFVFFWATLGRTGSYIQALVPSLFGR